MQQGVAEGDVLVLRGRGTHAPREQRQRRGAAVITAPLPETETDAPTVGLAPLSLALDLAAVPTAVSCSRMFIRHTLMCWSLPHLVDEAELIVSELVTNATRATGITTLQPSWSELEGVQLIQVRVQASKDSIVLQAWDSGDEPLGLPAAGADGAAESGRGLYIVQSLARQVGCFYPKSGGKVVWAELPLDPPVPPLPRHVAKKPATINLPRPEPELLRAVLAGLRSL
ncbi:ATP-binding protein [Streptomyces sp. NPDC003688]